jgi:hypothetical protein
MAGLLLSIPLGIASGFHAASYGAYKDSPYESFLQRRFIRELVIALIFAIAFSMFSLAREESYLVVYLAIFALSRIVTEFWKLFVRVENQDTFKVPTQVHFFRKVIRNTWIRMGLGIMFLAVPYGVYRIGTLLPTSLSAWQKGVLLGFLIGLAEAMAGGYKDGTIEGFSTITFLRSPVLGAIGGMCIASKSTNLAFIVLGSIAFSRMFIEIKKFFQKKYYPGKFRSGEPRYPEWMHKRKVFLIPYVLTWILFAVLVLV